MNTNPSVPQLAAQVRSGQPAAEQDFLRKLQPHMERMLRRALSGTSTSPVDAALRRAAAEAKGDLAAVARSLCLRSAAGLAPACTDAIDATQLGGGAWHTATAVA
jgi:hypothetical protein